MLIIHPLEKYIKLWTEMTEHLEATIYEVIPKEGLEENGIH
jgi:hypothetical protein